MKLHLTQKKNIERNTEGKVLSLNLYFKEIGDREAFKYI